MFWGGPKAPSGQLFGCLGDIYFEVASFFCADMIDTGAELGFSNLFFTFNHPVPLLALSFFFMVLYQIHHVLLGNSDHFDFSIGRHHSNQINPTKNALHISPRTPPLPPKEGLTKHHQPVSSLRFNASPFLSFVSSAVPKRLQATWMRIGSNP